MIKPNRMYGKVYKGHTVPYGALVGASGELKKVYYTYGYLRDEDLPELPIDEPLDTEAIDPEQALLAVELRKVLEEALDTLTPKQAKTLRLRFGIGTSSDMTLDEIGRVFDLTKERIRQIEAKALRTLKHPSRADSLRKALVL